MFEGGALPSQAGTGRGSDGEGLAAAPHEEPQSQHQLDPALSLSLSLSLHPQPFKSLIRPPAGLQSEELKGRGVSGIIKGKKGDFVTKMAPFTRFFVE